MTHGATKKVVLLGMMTRIPVAGVVWQTVHYLLGLERLGYEAYYVEAHARTPSMLMEREEEDSSAKAATFIDGVMRRFGMGDRWAFHGLHYDNRCYGLSEVELKRLYDSAQMLINLHGGTEPRPELAPMPPGMIDSPCSASFEITVPSNGAYSWPNASDGKPRAQAISAP